MLLLIREYIDVNGSTEVTPVAIVSKNSFLRKIELNDHLAADIAEDIMNKNRWTSPDNCMSFYLEEIEDWR